MWKLPPICVIIIFKRIFVYVLVPVFEKYAANSHLWWCLLFTNIVILITINYVHLPSISSLAFFTLLKPAGSARQKGRLKIQKQKLFVPLHHPVFACHCALLDLSISSSCQTTCCLVLPIEILKVVSFSCPFHPFPSTRSPIRLRLSTTFVFYLPCAPYMTIDITVDLLTVIPLLPFLFLFFQGFSILWSAVWWLT